MIAILKQGSESRVIHEILRKLSTTKPLKAINAKKYCGILKVQEKPFDK